MRNGHRFDGLLADWQQALRTELIGDLQPGQVQGVTATLMAAAVSSHPTTTAALAATRGGITMLNTTTAATAATTAGAGATGAAAGATATGSLTAKIAAGALAASLVTGGAAAVTGNLPSGMQSFVADAAAHIGLELPRPEVSLDAIGDLGLGLGIGEIIDLGAAGRVSATVDASTGLVLTGIEEAAGFTADVVSRTHDAVMVRFESATETATVLLTRVDGEIVASVSTDAGANADGEAQSGAEVGARAGTTTSVESDDASVDAGTESSIQIGIGR